ncbi:MAG: PHP domain-containing protein [Bacteroidales bacterium]|nr:PHP domain-containing protein [Bacteroidales bacterium]
MRTFRADLHIHTLLSPCGDLEMSPANIVAKAKVNQLDIIGITDHNSTKHCRLTRKLAEKEGITVLCGAEVTTKEEVHCLAFFETDDTLALFQQFLERQLPPVMNEVHRFGYQVVIDEEENIVEEVEKLLLTGLHAGINKVEQMVHELGGIFIPAHVDRPYYSILSQLGFIPPDLKADALEISRLTNPEDFDRQQGLNQRFTFLKSSDAHYISDIGRAYSQMWLEAPTFSEIKMALVNEKGRYVKIQ